VARNRSEKNDTQHSVHVYEVRPRKDKRGTDLISYVLPFGRLWYGGPDATANAIEYAKFRNRSHDVVIRVCDETRNERMRILPQRDAYGRGASGPPGYPR